MKLLSIAFVFLSMSSQAEIVKRMDVPNCYAQAREIAKQGSNVNVYEHGTLQSGITYSVGFVTKTDRYNISCRGDRMMVQKWSKIEWDKSMQQSKAETQKLAKQIGM